MEICFIIVGFCCKIFNCLIVLRYNGCVLKYSEYKISDGKKIVYLFLGKLILFE